MRATAAIAGAAGDAVEVLCESRHKGKATLRTFSS